jgi:hypothetical protein
VRHRPGRLAQQRPPRGRWPLRLEIDASALPLQPLLDAFEAAKPARATVEASGRILVELPLRAPSRLRYASSDLALSGRVRRLEWRTAPFTLRGDRAAAELQGLRLSAGGPRWRRRDRSGSLRKPVRPQARGQLISSLDPALPGRTRRTGELQLRERESPCSRNLARGRSRTPEGSSGSDAAALAGREL